MEYWSDGFNGNSEGSVNVHFSNVKIPLNPPLLKGDFLAKSGFPPLKKGG